MIKEPIRVLEDTHKTKYLVFKRVKLGSKKTYNVDVLNKQGEILGTIQWRSGWRTYVFTPLGNIDFDSKCLKDITSYIGSLLTERKGTK